MTTTPNQALTAEEKKTRRVTFAFDERSYEPIDKLLKQGRISPEMVKFMEETSKARQALTAEELAEKEQPYSYYIARDIERFRVSDWSVSDLYEWVKNNVTHLVYEHERIVAANAELEKEADLQRLRVASLLFSGVFDNFTGGQIVAWVDEYEDAKKESLSLRDQLDKAESENQYLKRCLDELNLTEISAENVKLNKDVEYYRSQLDKAEKDREVAASSLQRVAFAYEAQIADICERHRLERQGLERERDKYKAAYETELREWHNFLTYGQGGATYADSQLIDKVNQLEAEVERVKGLAGEFAEILFYQNSRACGQNWQTDIDPVADSVVAYLLSLGILEKHPERPWYRWVTNDNTKGGDATCS
jgi:hypothetical protein